MGHLGYLASGGVWRARDRRRRRALEKDVFQLEIGRVARAARADRKAYLGWEGERELRVAAIVDETHDVKSFYLTDPAGHALPRFEPGQYLTCHFETPPDEKPLVRCYSLSDRPHEEYYRLTVKRCDPPADDPSLPPGRGSCRLHRHTRVGDSLRVAAPRGGFFLDPRRTNSVVLVAGGIGVTPMVRMLAELVHTGDPREIYFFYGVRNGGDHALRSQIEELVAERTNVHLFIAYSQPRDSDREFSDYQFRGRITAEYLRDVLPTGKFDYYLCGPGPMMQSLVVGLLESGVSDEAIHYEAFGPASVRPSQVGRGGDPTCAVQFAASKKSVAWDSTYASLLELIEQAGVPIDSGCRSGNCGMCLARVLEGTTTTMKQPGADVPSGYCLACITLPASDLLLEI